MREHQEQDRPHPALQVLQGSMTGRRRSIPCYSSWKGPAHMTQCDAFGTRPQFLGRKYGIDGIASESVGYNLGHMMPLCLVLHCACGHTCTIATSSIFDARGAIFVRYTSL